MVKKKLVSNEERVAYLNTKAQEICQREEDELVLDFDQALAEKAEKPIKVKFQGKVYNVPAQMPFNFAMFFFRNCYKKISGRTQIQVPEEKLAQFVELMFGKEFLSVVEKTSVPMNFVFDTIAQSIMAKWGYATQPAGGEVKNAQTPGS